jgi:hypothetical protein
MKTIKVVPTQTGAEVYSVPQNVLLGTFNDSEGTFLSATDAPFTNSRQLLELSAEMQRRAMKKRKSPN